MLTHSIDLDVVGWGRAHGSATAEVAHYDFPRRLRRALAVAGLVWLVAIPIMLVPWFVITVLIYAIPLSVILFVIRMRAPDVATVCRGTCPDCGYVQTFDVPVRFELPLEVECAKCSRGLTLKRHH